MKRVKTPSAKQIAAAARKNAEMLAKAARRVGIDPTVWESRERKIARTGRLKRQHDRSWLLISDCFISRAILCIESSWHAADRAGIPMLDDPRTEMASVRAALDRIHGMLLAYYTMPKKRTARRTAPASSRR